MDGDLFSFAHPLWLWLAGGALLLIGEAVTGSSWLLWPAVCAAAVGALTAAGLDFPLQDQLALWAVLSVVSTFAARRLFPKSAADHGPDINAAMLPGRAGRAIAAFDRGHGRVLVDGCEWSAELDGQDELPAGARVEVLERLDGARLRVRAREI